MKMKIIDLLIKIANGEEVPNRVRFNNIEWNRVYGEKNVYYINEYDNDLFIHFFRKNLHFTLNDEVEIPKEENKIEKLYHCCMESDNEEIKFLIKNINDLSDKFNEVIDEINKLKENKDV